MNAADDTATVVARRGAGKTARRSAGDRQKPGVSNEEMPGQGEVDGCTQDSQSHAG